MQQAFFGINTDPAAVLPKLLPAYLLPSANSLNMTVFMAGGIAGPLVGGALIPLVGFSWLYLVDTLTLFATLGAVWGFPPCRSRAIRVVPGRAPPWSTASSTCAATRC